MQVKPGVGLEMLSFTAFWDRCQARSYVVTMLRLPKNVYLSYLSSAISRRPDILRNIRSKIQNN